MAEQNQQLVPRPDQPMVPAGVPMELEEVGPIVVQPGNGGRPNIYMHAPQFQWQHLQIGGEDQQARAGVQQIAGDCFHFGNEVNDKLKLLDAAYTPLKELPDAVGGLRGRLERIEAARDQGEFRGLDFSREIHEL